MSRRSLLISLACVVLASFAGLQLFPQPAFAYKAKCRNFTVYSDEPIDANLSQVVQRADTLLRRSPLYDDSPQNVFLTSSDRKYYFFVPIAPGSYGLAMQLSRNIFLRHADVSRDQLQRRSLSAVLAHERAHVLAERKLGLFKANTMAAWKKEGYPEYVAHEPISLSKEDVTRIKTSGLQSIMQKQGGYVVYHLRVKYLIDIEKSSFDDLIARDFDLAQLDAHVVENFDRLSN